MKATVDDFVKYDIPFQSKGKYYKQQFMHWKGLFLYSLQM
jgi:hypothetical protein